MGNDRTPPTDWLLGQLSDEADAAARDDIRALSSAGFFLKAADGETVADAADKPVQSADSDAGLEVSKPVVYVDVFSADRS